MASPPTWVQKGNRWAPTDLVGGCHFRVHDCLIQRKDPWRRTFPFSCSFVHSRSIHCGYDMRLGPIRHQDEAWSLPSRGPQAGQSRIRGPRGSESKKLFALFKVTEFPKEPLFLWVIAIDSYLAKNKNEKFKNYVFVNSFKNSNNNKPNYMLT